MSAPKLSTGTDLDRRWSPVDGRAPSWSRPAASAYDDRQHDGQGADDEKSESRDPGEEHKRRAGEDRHDQAGHDGQHADDDEVGPLASGPLSSKSVRQV